MVAGIGDDKTHQSGNFCRRHLSKTVSDVARPAWELEA